MDPYSFLFDADQAHYRGISSSILALIYAPLLANDVGKREAFRLRTGLLLHHLADRPVEVRTPEKPDPSRRWHSGGGTTLQADTTMWLALVADLADSARDRWYRFKPLSLPYHLATRATWIVSVSALQRVTAEYLDRELIRADPGYLGALQIDVGNPVQFQFLWGDQVETHVYERGHLGLISDGPWAEDEYPLDEESQWWWSRLQFDSVFWLRPFDEPMIGEELILSEPLDRNRALPADLKRGKLSARGTASEMLYKTGARLTIVERVATAVVGEMQKRGKPVPAGLTISTTRVPEASKAFVQRRRLEEYILSSDHPQGQHKAQLFKDVLGLESADWRYLADQLVQGLPMADVVDARANADGTMQFHVHTLVQGRNGRTVPVLSSWLVRPSSPPELITTYPSPKNVYIDDPDSFLMPRIVYGFDATQSNDCGLLFKIANDAGISASSLVIPTPMFIGGDVIAEGMFGLAWIVVKDARRGFARWLVKEGKAETWAGYPGARMQSQIGYPHIQRAEAYAQAFAEVLDVNNVVAYVEARLD